MNYFSVNAMIFVTYDFPRVVCTSVRVLPRPLLIPLYTGPSVLGGSSSGMDRVLSSSSMTG